MAGFNFGLQVHIVTKSRIALDMLRVATDGAKCRAWLQQFSSHLVATPVRNGSTILPRSGSTETFTACEWAS
jgi:hypothetical protein